MNREAICGKVKILVWVSVIVSVLCCGVVSCKKNKNVEEPVETESSENTDENFPELEREVLTEEEILLAEMESEFEDDFEESEDGWIEVGEAIESPELNLTDSNARLRMLKFEDEIFIPETRGDEKVLISSDGKKVRRSFYDDKYRLTRRELWKISDLKNSKITSSEDFVYEGDSLSPSEKLISNGDITVKTYFNDDGTSRKTETYKYFLKKSDDEESEIKIEYLVSSVEWRYNDEGKVTSENAVSYEYTKDNYSAPSSVFRNRHVYAYNSDDEIPPDYEYFEDGKLRIKTVYTEKDEYRTDTFFDSDYTVSAFYEESKKVKENYYQNGVLIRTKNYE